MRIRCFITSVPSFLIIQPLGGAAVLNLTRTIKKRASSHTYLLTTVITNLSRLGRWDVTQVGAYYLPLYRLSALWFSDPYMYPVADECYTQIPVMAHDIRADRAPSSLESSVTVSPCHLMGGSSCHPPHADPSTAAAIWRNVSCVTLQFVYSPMQNQSGKPQGPR